MRIPTSCFDADDKVMSESHGTAIVLDGMRRAQQVWLASYIADHRPMVGISTNIDPPLPPSYDEDLAEWLRDREHAQAERERVGDCAGNHDEPKIAASASTWRLGHDVPASERTGLWHVRLLIGCSMAIPAERLQFDSATEYRPAAPGTEEGDPYDESRYAAQAAPEKRHFMCIKKNKSGFFDIRKLQRAEPRILATVRQGRLDRPRPDADQHVPGAEWRDRRRSETARRHCGAAT